MIEQTPPITPQEIPQEETVISGKQPLSKKKRILIYIVGGILILIASIAVGYFVGCNKGGEAEEEKQPVQQEEESTYIYRYRITYTISNRGNSKDIKEEN